MHTRHILCALAAVATAVTLDGCVSAGMISKMIVDAPNGGHPRAPSGWIGVFANEFYSERFTVPAGPPPATLAVAIISPRNYGFSAEDKPGKRDGVRILSWRVANAPASAPVERAEKRHPSQAAAVKHMAARLHRGLATLPFCHPPAGTVMLLPGWGEPKETLLGYALYFANNGYRVILVDLRGQGASSGKYVTYGLVEHRDIAQLIGALQMNGYIYGKLALVGLSEGATIALDTAASDPDVTAVVAVAPFTNLETAIRGVGNVFMPGLSKRVDDGELDEALKLANRRVGMNLADANPAERVGEIHAPVLYVAGGDDRIAPAAAIQSLATATPNGHYTELKGDTHFGLYSAVAQVGPVALAALTRTIGASGNSACLHSPLNAPKDRRYHFTFSAKTARKEH